MLKKEIMKLIKSNNLLDKINETKFYFSDLDLLAMAYKYAPNFDERMRFLEKIAFETSDIKIVECANGILDYERSKYKDFITVQDNEVYEVLIKQAPNCCEERYLAKTYIGALNKINLFYDYYADIGALETENSRYTILKRKVIDSLNIEDFDEDTIGQCSLIYKSILYDVISNENDDSNVGFLLNHFIQFPKFLNDGDLVSYSDYHFNKVYVVVTYSEIDDSCACIVDLDNEYINKKTIHQKDENGYYPVFMHHEHIEYPMVSIEIIDDVPDEIKEKYYYFMGFWKSINFEK